MANDEDENDTNERKGRLFNLVNIRDRKQFDCFYIMSSKRNEYISHKQQLKSIFQNSSKVKKQVRKKKTFLKM